MTRIKLTDSFESIDVLAGEGQFKIIFCESQVDYPCFSDPEAGNTFTDTISLPLKSHAETGLSMEGPDRLIVLQIMPYEDDYIAFISMVLCIDFSGISTA